LPSIVTVSKGEWEAFLTDHSRLVRKYELLLSNIELARTKMEGIREKTEQQMAKSGETLRQVKRALDRLCEETETQLVESE
jgi:hypothetical protein